MKKTILGFAALAAFGLSAIALEQDPDLTYIMQRKLDNAHSILEALITEDFETLEDSAAALERLSEEAGWFVLQTPEYNERSTSFRRAAAEIVASAKERQPERAALAYVDMTLKCVQCHQYLRGAARAD